MNLLPDDIANVAPATVDGGYEPRDWVAHPLGGTGFAADFNLPEIPKSEWDDRINQQERDGTHIPAICEAMGLKPKHQGRTPLCWMFSVTMGQEIGFALDGRLEEPLSAGSVAAYKTGFRLRGGWCSEALEGGATIGWSTERLWKGTSVSKQYNTPEANAVREKYKATHWLDLQPKNVMQVAACVLRERPIPVPAAWMRIRHALTIVRMVKVNGKYYWLCWNSGYLRDAQGLTLIPLSWGGPNEALSLAVGTGG